MGANSKYNEISFNVAVPGVTVLTSGTSANVAIPNDASGNRAKYVRVSATTSCFLKFSNGAATCTNSDILVVGSYPEVYFVQNFNTVNYVQNAAPASLNITPLEA